MRTSPVPSSGRPGRTATNRRPRLLSCLSTLLLMLAPPALGDELGLVETVSMLLAHDPNVTRVEAQLDSARGGLMVASGRFEPLVTSSLLQADDETPSVDGDVSQRGLLQSQVGVVKELRTGQTVESSVLLARDDPAGPGGAVNEGSVVFSLRQPLLRDRSPAAVTAFERSAARSVEASERDLTHTLSERVLVVVDRYWRLRAAREELTILAESRELSEELLETTRRLVAADQRPAADVVLLEANVAAKQAAEIDGERRLFAARQDLGREIGLPPAEILRLGLPAEPFPTVESTPTTVELAERYVALAYASRADLAAAELRRIASETLEVAAENDLKPRLDLVLAPELSGAVGGTEADRFFAPVLDRADGFSTSLSLAFSFPPRTVEARGRLLQSQARSRIDATSVELLRVAIGAQVPSALEAVARGAERLVVSRRAVGLFEQALVNEQRKLQAGRSTLLDVISQQDRLTSARQAQVGAGLSLALAVVQLRFETGSLVVGEGDAARIDGRQLVTLPPLPGDAG